MKGQAVRIAVGFGFALVVASNAWAHHSHAPYDTSQLIAVEGTITKVEWKNPHMWIEMEVPDENGKKVIWGFEGSGTAATIQSGINAQWFKVGTHTKIVAHPSRAPQKVAAGCPLGLCNALMMGVEHNGKFYDRNPSNDTNKRYSGEDK